MIHEGLKENLCVRAPRPAFIAAALWKTPRRAAKRGEFFRKPESSSLTSGLDSDKIKVASKFTLDNTGISRHEEHQILPKT